MAEFKPQTYTSLRKFCHMFTARVLLRPVYHFRNQVEISGRENIPPNTKFLVVGNHLSQWDPPLLCIGTDIPMAYIAKTELFEIRLLKPLIDFFGAIPINRNKPEKSTIKTIKKVFETGWSVGMFIEGTRSKKPGYLGPPHLGAAYFAYSNHVPILPVGLVDTNKSWSKAKVVIGKPIQPSKDFEKTTWEVMEALSRLTGYAMPTEHQLSDVVE
jgi:1-acyl-sn-glycerol-3-phosphate acyltransferase